MQIAGYTLVCKKLAYYDRLRSMIVMARVFCQSKVFLRCFLQSFLPASLLDCFLDHLFIIVSMQKSSLQAVKQLRLTILSCILGQNPYEVPS